MPDTAATWTTYVHGEPVELPATIDGVRAALPEDERREFDAEIGRTPAPALQQVLGRWAIRTHREAAEETEETIRRLQAGDFTGCVPLDLDDADDDTEDGPA
jgi:hypothetical protein